MLRNISVSALVSLLMLIPAQAEDFKWMDEQGDLYTLSEAYKDQAVIVHFWASWCPPCVAEMPEMAAWLKKHPQVKLLAVSVDHDLRTALSFLQDKEISLTTVLTDQTESSRMAVRGLPTTLLINANHDIISSHIGMQNWQKRQWEERIMTLFSNTNSEVALHKKN